MFSIRTAAASCFMMLAVAGCGKKETPEYRLSAEQMAWQPYHVGDVLRFGQARSSKVRTFSITEVDDRIVELCNCGGIPVLAGPTPSRLQQIRVDVLRTDTVRYVRTSSSTLGRPDSIPITQGSSLLEMSLDDNHGSGPVVVRAQLYWDFGFYNYLPVQETIAGKAMPDTTTRALPSLQVGGITYGPVIQLSNTASNSAPLPRAKRARRLYYAKGVGVVAFLEGNTLWYRLP